MSWLLMRRTCLARRGLAPIGLVGLRASWAVTMCHVAERCSRGRRGECAPRALGEPFPSADVSRGEPKHDERSCSLALVGAESAGEDAGLRSSMLSSSPSDSVSSNSCSAAACRRREALIVCMRVLRGEQEPASLRAPSDSLVKTTQSSLSSPEACWAASCGRAMLLLPSAFGDCFRKRAAGLNSAIHRCSNTVLPVRCVCAPRLLTPSASARAHYLPHGAR